MKSVDIRFFVPSENSAPIVKKEKAAKAKKVILTGYISPAGKLVFPAKTVADLGVDFETTSFKVGMQDGKRKAKSLYLVPASEIQDETFQAEKAAKSYTISLPFILKKSGVDFEKSKFNFLIKLFAYEGITAFELLLKAEETTPKAPYPGKPRGRKAKQAQVE